MKKAGEGPDDSTGDDSLRPEVSPYIYQIFDGKRSAGRDVMLRIAFGMQLSVEDTQRLLTLSGNSSLYPKIRRDAALIYALDKKRNASGSRAAVGGTGKCRYMGRSGMSGNRRFSKQI